MEFNESPEATLGLTENFGKSFANGYLQICNLWPILNRKSWPFQNELNANEHKSKLQQ